RGAQAADVFEFAAAEEEKLVFDDRTAEGETEVVETQRRLRDAVGVVDEGVGVEFVIAEELEGAAVEFVLAAARYDVNRGACVSPVFRREVGSLDVDLANEIDADVVDLTVVAPRIQVEASVHGEQVGVGAAAIDRLGDAQASGQAELI